MVYDTAKRHEVGRVQDVVRGEDESVKGRFNSAKNTVVDDAHKVKDKITGRQPGTDK